MHRGKHALSAEMIRCQNMGATMNTSRLLCAGVQLSGMSAMGNGICADFLMFVLINI